MVDTAPRRGQSQFRPELLGKHEVVLTADPSRQEATVWRVEIDVQAGDGVQEFELKIVAR